MTVSLEALAMSGANFNEVGYDMDEFELIESEVPPYLLAEDKEEVQAGKDKLEAKWRKTDCSFSTPYLANFIEVGYNMDQLEKMESEIPSYLLVEDAVEEAECSKTDDCSFSIPYSTNFMDDMDELEKVKSEKVEDNKLEAALRSKSDDNFSIASLFCGFMILRKEVSKWSTCDFNTIADYGSEGKNEHRKICDHKLDAASWLLHESLVVIIIWSILGLLNAQSSS